MKKKLLVVLSSLVMLIGLAGCGSAATEICDFCDKEAVCDTITVLGEEARICDECTADLEDLY